jgi:hypothetical protein
MAFQVTPHDGDNLYTLTVTHSCGHQGAYSFGTKEAAHSHAHEYAAQVCLDCHNRKELAKLNRKSS